MKSSLFSIKYFRYLFHPLGILFTLLLIAATTAMVPAEALLGTRLRIVLLHGAWVWTGKFAFAAAAVSGLAAIISRREVWHRWSLVLGRMGMLFWLTYLPMSLWVMQVNWGGFFFDEPRWKIPFTFAVVGLLMQLGLALIRHAPLTSAANLLFGAALWWNLRGSQNILHPDSPIASSNSSIIQFYFIILLMLVLVLCLQGTLLWLRWTDHKTS